MRLLVWRYRVVDFQSRKVIWQRSLKHREQKHLPIAQQRKRAQLSRAQAAPVVEGAPKEKLRLQESSCGDEACFQARSKSLKKAAEKPKKKRFGFLSEVRSEMRRVTWPTKQEVLQWSGVVVVALLVLRCFCCRSGRLGSNPDSCGYFWLGGVVHDEEMVRPCTRIRDTRTR